MSPLPGIYASQISGHLFSPPSAYDALASVTLSATATSVVFASVPSGYKHLQIRFIGKSTRASGQNDLLVTINNDTTVSYSNHVLYGNGASVSSIGATNQSTYVRILANAIPSADTANIFAAGVVDILDYASTNKAKTLRGLGGSDLNGSGYITLGSILWMNTNAITSISFTPETFSWASNTQFALYGVK